MTPLRSRGRNDAKTIGQAGGGKGGGKTAGEERLYLKEDE